ncbi:hypothetical protein EVAR_96989_1 [Eumeta japonica]|uniref:Uncharacterized protein n=1 Tax=Eumeta variegata TaxID=151549 RepID=A0A4C1VGY8_EUMVA|nr:hypothetical protein EVAR_96989_1 [Eumeta japonica]
MINSGGARRRRRRRPPTASRLKGPRKQKSFAYKLLKRGLAKSFAYKLLKRGLANLMSPTSTSGVAPPLMINLTRIADIEKNRRSLQKKNDVMTVSKSSGGPLPHLSPISPSRPPSTHSVLHQPTALFITLLPPQKNILFLLKKPATQW